MPYRNPVSINSNRYNKNYKIKDAYEDFLEYINQKNGGSKTNILQGKNNYARAKTDLKKFLKFAKEHNITYTMQINNELVNNYNTYIANYKKSDGNDLALNSKNTIITQFRGFITFCAKHNAIKQDVYNFIFNNSDMFTKNIKRAMVESETGYLTPEQILKMYNNLDKYYLNREIYLRNKSIFLLLMHGLRLGEVLGLKWRDIDIENSSVKIYRSKTFKENTIYVSKLTVGTLAKYKSSLNMDLQMKDYYIYCGKRKDKYKNVIIDNTKHISQQVVNAMLKRLAEDETDSEGKKITARTFRKTFAVQNMKLGNKLPLIQTYTQHTLHILQKNYSIYFKNEELSPKSSIEKYFSYTLETEMDTPEISVEDVLSNPTLVTELREHFYEEFAKTFADTANFKKLFLQ